MTTTEPMPPSTSAISFGTRHSLLRWSIAKARSSSSYSKIRKTTSASMCSWYTRALHCSIDEPTAITLSWYVDLSLSLSLSLSRCQSRSRSGSHHLYSSCKYSSDVKYRLQRSRPNKRMPAETEGTNGSTAMFPMMTSMACKSKFINTAGSHHPSSARAHQHHQPRQPAIKLAHASPTPRRQFASPLHEIQPSTSATPINRI